MLGGVKPKPAATVPDLRSSSSKFRNASTSSGTATSCPSCAEIDPELLQVADSHGSRIALVALHPSDGEDAFQPAASQHRINRLETVQAGVSTSTPTFVVEAGAARRGYDAWAEVQRDILNEELARQNTSGLDITVERTTQGYRASVASAYVAHPPSRRRGGPTGGGWFRCPLWRSIRRPSP